MVANDSFIFKVPRCKKRDVEVLLCLHWRRGARQVTGSQSSLTLGFLRNEIQRKENKAMLQLGIPGYMQDSGVSDGLVCIEMYSYL